MAIRVLLADDHVVLRQGLKTLLQREGVEVVGEAGDGAEATELAEKLHPEIAILDIAMPILNGIDAARQISKVSPRTQTILLTMLTEDDYVLEGLRAGARGYVLKSRTADEVIEAIHEVSKGGLYLTPRASGAVVQAFIAGSEGKPPQLTDRERQVVQLIAEGKSTKEVASTLNITVRTAESHRQNIMNHLGIHDVAGLVRYAIRHGLIQP